MSHGIVPDSLLTRALNDDKLIGFESEEVAAYVSMELIGAAADTVRIPCHVI